MNAATWANESRWYLVNNGLHVWLVDQVSVQQRGPLLGWNSQAGLHGDVDDLSVMFSPQSLVSPELFLQLHQRGVLVTLGHLTGVQATDGDGENKKEGDRELGERKKTRRRRRVGYWLLSFLRPTKDFYSATIEKISYSECKMVYFNLRNYWKLLEGLIITCTSWGWILCAPQLPQLSRESIKSKWAHWPRDPQRLQLSTLLFSLGE